MTSAPFINHKEFNPERLIRSPFESKTSKAKPVDPNKPNAPVEAPIP